MGGGLLRIPFLLTSLKRCFRQVRFGHLFCIKFCRRITPAKNFNKTTPSAPKLTGATVNLWFEARSNFNSPL